METIQLIFIIIIPLFITLINIWLFIIIRKRSYYFTKREASLLNYAIRNVVKGKIPDFEILDIIKKLNSKK